MDYLASVKRKMRRMGGREYVACLTPVEIVAVAKAGWKINPYYEHKIERAQNDIKDGRSNPSWFYFYPPDDF